jgi:hypothetical protein
VSIRPSIVALVINRALSRIDASSGRVNCLSRHVGGFSGFQSYLACACRHLSSASASWLQTVRLRVQVFTFRGRSVGSRPQGPGSVRKFRCDDVRWARSLAVPARRVQTPSLLLRLLCGHYASGRPQRTTTNEVALAILGLVDCSLVTNATTARVPYACSCIACSILPYYIARFFITNRRCPRSPRCDSFTVVRRAAHLTRLCIAYIATNAVREGQTTSPLDLFD